MRCKDAFVKAVFASLHTFSGPGSRGFARGCSRSSANESKEPPALDIEVLGRTHVGRVAVRAPAADKPLRRNRQATAARDRNTISGSASSPRFNPAIGPTTGEIVALRFLFPASARSKPPKCSPVPRDLVSRPEKGTAKVPTCRRCTRPVCEHTLGEDVTAMIDLERARSRPGRPTSTTPRRSMLAESLRPPVARGGLLRRVPAPSSVRTPPAAPAVLLRSRQRCSPRSAGQPACGGEYRPPPRTRGCPTGSGSARLGDPPDPDRAAPPQPIGLANSPWPGFAPGPAVGPPDDAGLSGWPRRAQRRGQFPITVPSASGGRCARSARR